MSIDRRKFLKAGVGAVLVASLRTAGRAVLTRIVPVIARAVPRMRLNLLRFLPR